MPRRGRHFDFRGDRYGLGAIDFSQVSQVARGYDVPAIGHGGEEPSNAARIVVFPQMDVVVAVQAYGTLYDVGSVVEALRDAAQP